MARTSPASKPSVPYRRSAISAPSRLYSNALDDSSALIEYWAGEGLEKMGVGMVFYKPE